MRDGDGDGLIHALHVPMLIIVAFWGVVIVLLAFPNIGTREHRVRLADAIDAISGGHDTVPEQALRLAAGGVPEAQRSMDRKGQIDAE